ncbi:MAG: FHA domain-containing protein [Tannerella sp.]|jgi:hypothetical protein|nr:FHA domain-containing protein [Tannerella sp.]
MERATKKYNPSFFGPIGAGMGSLFNASERKYYILEHKVSSKYHRIGELQKIIVDRIELGRAPNCQVRFDESFTTVSRKHAAIIREGDIYKLIPLSQTNTTFLNGKRVNSEWYLQHGDEIQLSVNGPKLGFVIPKDEQNLVSNIKFTERLNLFGRQALEPYKWGLISLGILLFLVIIGSLAWNYRQYREWQEDAELKAQQVAAAFEKNEELQGAIDSMIIAEKNKPEPEVIVPPAPIEDLVETCKDDIYYLSIGEVYITNGEQRKQIMRTVPGDAGEASPYGWNATGFLLNDGRFVTARRCIQQWRFSSDPDILRQVALPDSIPGWNVVAVIKAVSRSGKRFTINSTDFTFNDKYDEKRPYGVSEGETDMYIKSAVSADADRRICSTDWAYAYTSRKGKLVMDGRLSVNLRSGTELHVLGFSMNMDVGDAPAVISPAYSRFNAGVDGLDRNTGCFLYTKGSGSRNSGAPVFVRKENELVVVGIVSGGFSENDEYNCGIPVGGMK